jgi:arylsulfatase A-like enzyme
MIRRWLPPLLGVLWLLPGIAWAGSTVLIPANSSPVQSSGGTRTAPKNIVIVMLDDWGIDQDSNYYASTGAVIPRIQAAGATGLRFTGGMLTSWNCSPTRASLLFSSYPKDHGRGDVGFPPDTPSNLPTFVQVLQDAGYRTINIGKWHLSDPALATLQHTLGYDYHEGSIAVPTDYSSYSWCVEGTCATQTTYLTTYTVDRAIANLPAAGPFFMMLSLNAPHSVFHCPPNALTPTYDAICTPIGGETQNQAYMHAMLEAADTELFDFFSALNLATTTVLVFGDNGTDAGVCQGYASTRCKGTQYAGGVTTPFYAFGDQVNVTGTTAAVVSMVDIGKTVLDLAGVTNTINIPASVSFFPVLSNSALSPRTYAYSDGFIPSVVLGQTPASSTVNQSARSAQYHLVRRPSNADEFYDTLADPFEATNLCVGTCPAGLTGPQTTAYNKLVQMILNPTPGPT